MNKNLSTSDEIESDTQRICATQRFITPLTEAVSELRARQNNPELIKKVEEFVNGDIPEHFNNGPILYLSRHIATPSYATLRFIELSKPYDLPIIIGEDQNDLFVSHNSLKRSLGKMPIVKGVTRNSDEIIEFFTILDFAQSQGKPFKELRTRFDANLIEYHRNLLNDLYPTGIQIIDESDWIDRNHRGDLLTHYKKVLALLLVHGIMFEWYEPEDYHFVKNILAPAFEFVEKTFGCKPLICNLVEPEIESVRDWNSYPSVVYKTVKNHLERKN